MIIGTDSIIHNPIHRSGPGRFIPMKSAERFSWWFFVLIMLLFGALLHFSLSELNPDWFSYQVIYESDGAWLSERGRDPAFLVLIAMFANFFGSDGYEAFRIFFAFYFLLFLALLSSGCIFKLNLTKNGCVFLMIALVFLGCTRFTIQIREGLAITLIVFSMALIHKRSCVPEQFHLRKSKRRLGEWLCIAGEFSLLILAALIHAGTLPVLPIYLGALWAAGQGETERAQAWRLRLLWVFTFSIAGLSIGQLHLGGAMERIATETAGNRLMEAKALSVQQLGLWVLYGAACWLVFRAIRSSVKQQQIIGTFASFMQILAGPVITAAYVSILLALMLGISPLFVATYVRWLHLFLALALLGLAVTDRCTWLMKLVGVFLIVDQLRSILDAISIYSGVSLL